MRNREAPFQFKPFSTKQLKVMTWWLPNSPIHDLDMIIADGSVRSGKTVSMSLSYVMWSMEMFNGENFGMCGKTIGSFRRNVLNPLKRMLKVLKYKVIEHRADNMIEIRKSGRINYYYIFGGKDERSQDLIQGITLAGILFDEVVLMPQSFVNQAIARCSVHGSKIWFNCNPGGPYHWFKTEFIDKVEEKRILYLHFTMADNLSLGKQERDRYYRTWSGVFFKRYIEGLWVMAEGVIFDMFSEDVHVDDFSNLSFARYIVAIDYGTQNPTTFGLYGINGDKAYLVREYWYEGRESGRQKTDGEYADDLQEFLGSIVPVAVYVDPSAASFIAELRKRKIKTKKAKNDVVDGIRFVAEMLSTGRFFVDQSCTNTVKEFSSYVWDSKAAEHGEDKPIKQNDHAMDRNRYALVSYFKRLQVKSA